MANRTLAFLGFGKKKAETTEESEEDRKAREAREREAAEASDEDDDDEVAEDDEDEAKAETDDDKQAVRGRNALRAAGHRRGASAERGRIASALNGVDPAKAELALHLSLNSDMTPEQIKATVAKAPAGQKASAFSRAMEHHRPSVGAGPSGGKAPTLAERMKAALPK